MNQSYPTATVPATPDYVLSVIQDEHRQTCEYDEGTDPQAILSYDTTVSEWRDASDLVGWWQLGRALNIRWDIRCSAAEWHAVLVPAGKRTLRDVCNLIAPRAVQPVIRPATVLGRECAAAGAFLTVRALLRDAGAAADEIAPSTILAPYTRDYAYVFLGAVSRLAPGVLPPIRIQSAYADAVYSGGCFLILLSIVFLALGLAGLWVFTLVGVPLFVFSHLLMWFAGQVTPDSVEFGELRTFRDLATLLADRSMGEPA